MNIPQHTSRLFPLAAVVVALLVQVANGLEADSIPKSEEIIRRYIPASRLDAVTSKDAPGALLPIAEFEALLKAAAEKTGTGDVRPAGALLARSDYALSVADQRLLVTCRIALRSFDANWQTIRLPMQGLSVLGARYVGADETPRLARDPKQPDQLIVFLSEPGTKTLVLDLLAPLSATGGDSGAAFQLVNAPLGEMTLTLPAGKRLRMDGLLLERPAADDQPADYRLAIGGRPDIKLVITDRKAIDRTDAMTFASTSFGVLASPGEATWTARTQLTVFGRPLDKLECEVPSTLEITDVESQGLEAWQLSDGAAGRTRISLTWRQPFDGLRQITFRGVFSPERDSHWRVPNLVLQNVSSHTGTLLLERPAGVRLQVTQSSGIRPVEAADKSAVTDGHSASRFEIWKEDFSLEFVPAAKDREVQAAMSTLVSLNAQGADLVMTADIETRFAPLFEADIVVPAAWQVLQALHNGQKANWQLIPDEPGKNRIRIPLVPPLNPGENRSLSLTAHFEPEGWPVATTPIRIALPELRLPQAGVVEALYGITADADLEIIPMDVVGLTPARQSDVDTLNRQLAPFGRTVRLGFTYQDSIFTGQLEIRRLPARLSATCVTLTRIDTEEIASHVEAQLSIGGGGVRELTIQLPESVGRDLRFTLTHLRPRPLFSVPSTSPPAQQAIAPLPPLPVILEQKPGTAANGLIPWTIKLDRYAMGSFVLQAELSQPRPPAAAGQPQQWNVPALVVVGADRESGAIGIEAADDQFIQVETRDSAGQPMQPVDPIDFPPAHVQPRERLVAAFAYDRPGWTAAVAETRLTRIPMPTAVIHRLALASIVDADGVKQIQADATLSAVGIQSLVIRLPENHTLWGALVDGVPVQVHKSGTSLSLPLSPVDPPSRAREIRLNYAPADRGVGITKAIGGFRMEESPPAFLVITGEGKEQPLTVLASSWTVHHAADLDLVEANGVFHPATPLERDSLLLRLWSMFRIPRQEDATWRVAALAIVGVLLWLFASAQRRVPKVLFGCVSMLAVLCVAVSLTFRGCGTAMMSTSAPTVAATKTAPPRPTSNFGGESSAPMGQPANRAPDLFDVDRDLQSRFMTENELKKDHKELWADRTPPPPAAEPRAGAAVQFDAPALPAAPMAPAKPAGEEAASQVTNLAAANPRSESRGLVRGDGLLSVAFGLQPPAGSDASVVESTSDEISQKPGALSLRFMENESRNLWMSLAAFATAVVGWWLRKSGNVTRLLFLLVTLLGPVSARWLIPLAWLPIADGLWLGGLATLLLWTVRGCACGICRCCCWSRFCRPATPPAAVVAFVLSLTISQLAFAQDAATKAVPKPAPEAGPESVFIPYDNAKDPLSAKNVFIPQDLFLKLWRTAHPEDAPPVKPPVPATLFAAAFVVDLTALPASAAADGRSAPVLAPVKGRFVLNNLTTASTRLALPIHGVAIRSATLDGAPAILDSKNEKSLIVTLPRPGVAILDLEFDVTVQRTGPAGKFRWENSAVPSGLLGLKLPKTETEIEVRVGGVKAPPKPAVEGNGLTYEVAIDRGGVQEISWQPAASRSGEDSPVQVQATTSVVIDDAGLTMRTAYTAKVSQGGVTELTLAFPGSMRLKKVEGADLGGWRIDGENAARKLVVFFSRKIDSATTFHVEAFQPLAIDEQQQPVTIAPPQPEGVSRETGKLGVYLATHLSARATNAGGLTQEDLSQFPAAGVSTPHPLRLAYRYAARPISLDLVVQRRQAETRADVGHGVLVTQRKLRVSTKAVFHIAGAPRSSLTVQLPAGYLLLDVSSPALVDYSTTEGDAGRKILTIELDRPRTGDLEVLLNGTLPRRPEEPSSVVVTPRLLDVSKVESELGVWVEDLYVATADALGDWKNADPNSLDAALRGLRPAAMQFGFRSTSLDPQPVTLGLRAQSAELSADVLSLIAVSDASVDYGFTMQWRITRAATDTFSFTSPGWLRGKIDFAGVGIRQVTSTDLPGDRVKWTISLTDPVRDTYLLTGAASLAAPADGRVISPDLSFESAGAGGAATRLETQRQYAVVVNLSRRPLALEDPAAVQTVPREALPLKVPDQLVRQAMTIVQVVPGRTASWLARRVQTAASLQATITGARLESVVEVDGSWRTQATYTLRNRGRQYVPLDLSAMGDVRVLSILVKGKPARALETTVGGKKLHLVPLPPSSAADLSYDVVVMLAGKMAKGLPKNSSIASTTLELPAPHITTPAESAQFGIPVAQTAWVVRLPDGIVAEIDDAGNLTPHQAAEWELLASAQTLSTLESDAAEMLRIVSDGESSEQRRIQAWYNLSQLSLELDNNRKQIDEVAQKAEPLLGEKGVELSRSNLGRNASLKAKVDLQLQTNEAAKAAAPQAAQSAPTIPLPQLQGSLNNDFSFQQNLHGNAVNAPGQVQSGGRAYILGNSFSILNSNGIAEDSRRESGAAEFGFTQPKKESQAGDKALSDEKSGEAAGKSSSRSGLQRRLSEQQQAVEGLDRSRVLEQKNNQEFSGGMGGIGGGGGRAAGPAGFRFQGQRPELAAGRVDLTDPMMADGAVAIAAPAGWSSGAGLSLAMSLPAVGEKSLAFSKVGGDPKLVLKARSLKGRRTAWGLGEVALAVIVGVWLLSAAAAGRRFGRTLAILAAVLGAVGFLFLPGFERWAALAVFTAALAWLAIRGGRPAAAATPTA